MRTLLPSGSNAIGNVTANVMTFKFYIGDVLQEKENNSAYRYTVTGRFPADGIYPNGHTYPYDTYTLTRHSVGYYDETALEYSKTFVESTFEAINTEAIGYSCSHEWAVYDSGFRSFEYCKKCDKNKE